MTLNGHINKVSFIGILSIVIVSVIIFSNTFKSPFIFDDLMQIQDKAKIRNLENYASTKMLFSKRPLAELTFAMNYRLDGLNVFGYHLVNLVIHIINGILAFLLTFNLVICSINYPLNQDHKLSKVTNVEIGVVSLFAALIFVAHPIQTESVTYVVQRYSGLAAMFYMASVFLYIRGRMWQLQIDSSLKADMRKDEDPLVRNVAPIGLFVLCFIFGIMAFLSKENAASLPGVILMAEWVLFDRSWKGWKRKLIWFLPAIACLAVFILYVSGAFRGEFDFGKLLEDVSAMSKETSHVSRWNYLCTQFNVIVIYVRLLFLPFGQNLDYMYPFKNGFFDGLTPLAFLFVIGIIFLGVWNVKKRPLVAFGVFWFIITLSIESSIIPIRDAMFEHRLYLPMFGFSLVIAYLGYLLLPVNRFWRIVILSMVIVGLGTMTYLRNEVYEKRVTIWSDVVAKSPQNYRAYYNLGNAFRDENRLDEAIQSYSKALTVKPNFAFAHDNMGVVLLRKGMVDDAIQHFYEALEKRPHDAMTHCNLGAALMQKGKLDAAIKEFRKALKRNPSLVEARNNLGIALAQQGKLEKAIQNFEKALRIEPENPEIHSNLGFALLLQGKPQESLGHLFEAVRLNPNYAEAHTRLGSALTRLGKYDEAILHFSKALEIAPRLEQAKLGLRRAIALGKRKSFQ